MALVGSVLLTLLGHQALGQSIATATITEILDGNQVYIQNRAAQVNSVAQQQQQVRTLAARASLRFNTGAVARLAHNSSLVIGQCAQLNRGTLLVNGALNGCSTSTLAGVRGTIYTIEVNEAEETTIKVFEGTVVVGRNPNPEPITPMGNDFDPMNPSLEPAVPTTDPVVPFANPMEPSSTPPGPMEPPSSGEPPIVPGRSPGIDSPTTDPSSPGFTPSTEPITPPPSPSTAPPLGFGPQDSTADSLLAARTKQTRIKQDNRRTSVADLVANVPPETAEQEETVDFTVNDSLTLAEGQQAIINPEAEEAVILELSPEDFIDLLEGPLINGFALEIPGIGNLRRSFEQLFPGVPLPQYWLPSIPSPPIRFPFPF